MKYIMVLIDGDDGTYSRRIGDSFNSVYKCNYPSTEIEVAFFKFCLDNEVSFGDVSVDISENEDNGIDETTYKKLCSINSNFDDFYEEFDSRYYCADMCSLFWVIIETEIPDIKYEDLTMKSPRINIPVFGVSKYNY